ncbi:site-specific integrase [Streptomyces phytophilus]|uniref:site-specific integrase n=1 Tax=Streptomyces phytophilus TaxID=722715 RepID=UPI0028681ABC|nr:N-terminal phage integrase SAM-like domain-containing protein [Streptomyces phytophilus]
MADGSTHHRSGGTYDGPRAARAKGSSGKRWQVRYRDLNGAQRKENYEIKAKADARAAEVENDLQRCVYVTPSAGKITLAKYAEQWLAAVTAGPTTYERYEREIRNHVVPHLGGHEVRNLTRPSSIQGWIKKVQAAGLEASSIGCVHDVLVGMLDAAVEDGLLARNPCRSSAVKLPKHDKKPVTPWSLDRVQAVISALPDRKKVFALPKGDRIRSVAPARRTGQGAETVPEEVPRNRRRPALGHARR